MRKYQEKQGLAFVGIPYLPVHIQSLISWQVVLSG